MPSSTPSTYTAGLVEPRDAVAALQRRKLLEPSFRWQDVWQDEHSSSFAVAGVQRLDVLEVFQKALDTKFAEGTGLAEYRKVVRQQLVAKGWWGDVEVTDTRTGETRISRFDDRRLQLIYDVNTRQSYAAGQWARIQRTKATKPFLVYRTMDDDRVRKEHRTWDYLVLPVDHPFWLTHFPPNGWRCRCIVFAASQRDIDKLLAAGKKLRFEAPTEQLINYVNPRTGEIAAVPRGIDPGFAYNPGVSRDTALHEMVLRKAWAASPLAGAAAVAHATFARQEMVAAATEAFGDFVNAALSNVTERVVRNELVLSHKNQSQLFFLGALKPAVVRELDRLGQAPITSAIAVSDFDVYHALRSSSSSKVDKEALIDRSVYKRLPELLERASAVLLDTTKPMPSLLFIVDLLNDNGRVGKLVLNLDFAQRMKIEGKRVQPALNIVRTATVMKPDALKDANLKLLWGKR